MTKKLLVVAASGLVLAILLLSASWAIGGKDMVAAIHKNGGNWTFDSDEHGPRTSRALAFHPALPMTVDAPVSLHFQRGDHAGMTISGPPAQVAAMHWENNHLTMNGGVIFGHHALRVEIVAPQMPPLRVSSAGNINLENLSQPDLRIELQGAGNVDASGTVQSATVSSSGAGNVDLGELHATDATVSLEGVGNVDINASGKVAVTMSGAGHVSLHQKPAQLTSQINGLGSVDHDY